MDARLEGILEDMARDPADHSLCHILADFLEDQGEFTRAHLIRLQLEHQALPEENPRLPGLEHDDQALVAQHGATWVDGPPPPGVLLDWWLGRLSVDGGGAECLEGPGRDWLLRQARWLAGFSVSGASEAVLADLISAGCLRLVNRLELYDPGVTDACLAQLARLPYLRELHLHCREVTAGGLAHLVDLPRLRELHIKRRHLSESVVAQLGWLTQLQELTIWTFRGNRFAEASVPEEVLEELRGHLPHCRVHEQVRIAIR